MLWMLTLATVLLGSAFALGVPMFQHPDEPSHLDRVRHQAAHPFDIPGSDLRMQRTVVKASERVGLELGYHQGWPADLVERAPQPPFSEHPGAAHPACPSCQSYQYAHPPAYYWLAAPISFAAEVLPADLHLLVLRLLSVVIAAPIPWLVWWTAAEVAPGAGVGVPAAALAALNGPVVAATSAVNNDALAYTASAAVLAVSASVLRAGLSPARAWTLGAAVAIAGLTKVTALPVAVVGGLVLLFGRGPTTVRHRVGALAAAGLGAAWWLRNLLVAGRLTPGGTELFDASQPPVASSDGYHTFVLDQIGLLLHRSLGLYGWAQALVPDWVGWGVLGAAVALVAAWSARTWPWRRPGRFAVLAAVPVLSILATLASSYGNYIRTGAVTGLSGRYLYPAAPVLWVAIAAALATVARSPGNRRRAASATTLVAATAGIGSLAFCLVGLYETTGIRTMVERMELTAPLSSAAPAVAVLALGVVAAAVSVATALARGPETAIDR